MFSPEGIYCKSEARFRHSQNLMLHYHEMPISSNNGNPSPSRHQLKKTPSPFNAPCVKTGRCRILFCCIEECCCRWRNQ